MEQLLYGLLFISLVALIKSTYASSEPCTAMDPGFSPSSPPRLFIDVNEASEQDLKYGGNQYVSEIRLHGAYGAKTPNGIHLTFGSSYRMVDPNEYFAFEYEQSTPFRNIIRLIKPLDRDGPTDSVMDDTIIDHFRLKCVPYKNNTSEYWYDVSLLIHDINDNVPQMAKDNVYSAVVNELTPVGATLPIKVSVTDKDSGNNRQLTYKISTANGSTVAEHLGINNETGKVYLHKAFDYENLSVDNRKFSFPVIVHDNGKLQLTSTATLTITVTDGDDLGPQFRHLACQKAFGGKCFTPTYNADVESVLENSPILFQSSGGGPLMQIKAKDGDTLAAKIDFKISAVLPSQYKSNFKIRITPPEKGSDGYYTASLTLIKSIDKSALVGTVVYITATEDTTRHLFSVARILFKRRNSTETKVEKIKDSYNSETLALIVVVAILSVIAVTAFIALICFHLRKSKNEKMIGHINEGMSHL